jgi:hypothetical protein
LLLPGHEVLVDQTHRTGGATSFQRLDRAVLDAEYCSADNILRIVPLQPPEMGRCPKLRSEAL